MESLYLLIPVALVFCAIAIRLLLWAIDNGQYDDLDKESWRILADEDEVGRGKRDEGAATPQNDRGESGSASTSDTAVEGPRETKGKHRSDGGDT